MHDGFPRDISCNVFTVAVWLVGYEGNNLWIYNYFRIAFDRGVYLLRKCISFVSYASSAVIHQGIKDDMNFFSMIKCKSCGLAEVSFIRMICDVDHENAISFLLKSHTSYSLYSKRNMIMQKVIEHKHRQNWNLFDMKYIYCEISKSILTITRSSSLTLNFSFLAKNFLGFR